MGLGLWGNETQSENPLDISKERVIEKAAEDYNVPKSNISIIGWFDIPTNHPDRKLHGATYTQAVEVEYNTPARALYGITEGGRNLLIWAD